MTIRNPVEWSADSIKSTAFAVTSALRHADIAQNTAQPDIRQITRVDLKDALIKGFQDFAAYRTDVVFLCFIYPLAGLVAARVTLNYNQLPLLFPFISGFALVGPCAAAGLYEMSRLREQGKPVSWVDAFDVFGSPRITSIVKLGVVLTGIFLLWLAAATAIYDLTLGPAMPSSISSFLADVFTTKAGWAMTILGDGVGLVFALLVLAISVVSFPLLIDRRISISTAVRTSIQAVMLNKATMLTWGLIVAGGLVLGAIPALLGLIVVMPVLGHATWHLYRKVVV